MMGPYGEIVPEPLVHGLTLDDLLSWWREQTGEEVDLCLLPVAMLAFHQHRMRMMFTRPRNDEEKSLAQAILGGMPVSIVPGGLQGGEMEYATFAPVLTFLGDGKWQLGLPDLGRCEQWQAEPETAVQRAQECYAEWVTAEWGGEAR